MRALLQALSYLDWITPATRALRGPSATLRIPERSDASGADMERVLRRAGIRTWAGGQRGSTVNISVRPEQAGEAERLLIEAGYMEPARPEPRRGLLERMGWK